MGETRVQKDRDGKEVKTYLTKCNDCEGDVLLSSTEGLTEKQLDELQKRMLCSKCLNKKLERNK